MDVIEKLMKKEGVDIENMSPEEKATHDKWRAVLTGKEISVDKIAEFCRRQKSDIEGKFENLDNPEQRNDRLIIYHNIYSKIIRMIEAEETERLRLEQELTNRLDTNTNYQV